MKRSQKGLTPLEIPIANKRNGKFLTGLTLLELMIASALLGLVVLLVSTVMISFKTFYFDFVQRQTDNVETTLVVLEDIVNKIKISNKIELYSAGTRMTTGEEIHIRVDNTDPTTVSDDITYRYYRAENDTIRYRYMVGDGVYSEEQIVARNVEQFLFELVPPYTNAVKIIFGVISGATMQTVETTVVAACRSAQETP